GHVQPVDRDRSGGHRQQAADHRQQRRLSGPVCADDGGDTTGRKFQADIVDDSPGAVAPGKTVQFDHRVAPRMRRRMKVSPPANSTTMLSAELKANTRSSTTWPP